MERGKVKQFIRMGHVGPVVGHSAADCGSNSTLAYKRKFPWAQEMNLRGSTLPRCELVP